MKKKISLLMTAIVLSVVLCACLTPQSGNSVPAGQAGNTVISERMISDSKDEPNAGQETEAEILSPERTDSVKADSGKTDGVKNDSGKTDGVKNDSGITDGEKADGEKSDGEKAGKEITDSEKTDNGKDDKEITGSKKDNGSSGNGKEEQKKKTGPEKIALEEASVAEEERIAQEAAKAEEERIAAQEAAKTEMVQKTEQTNTGDAGLELINSVRAQAGIGPLVYDSTLSALATLRAQEVSRVWGHSRPDGTSCFTILDENGVSYSICGENIAAGHTSVTDAVNSWLNSTGHRANILNGAYTKMGIGLYTCEDEYGYYWVQIFTD